MTSSLEFREFENKNAVVVGIGNSGCDSAVELRYEKCLSNSKIIF